MSALFTVLVIYVASRFVWPRTNSLGKLKVRIVERTADVVTGRKVYVIEQKHFIFTWWWVEASVNRDFVYTKDTFNTKQEAIDALPYFDGTNIEDVTVFDSSED